MKNMGYARAMRLIKADYRRYSSLCESGGVGKVKSFLKILLFERGFRFTFWWRLASVNFTISQFCTIGSNKGHAATIGDNVYIAPHCCIVEDVKIGDNSTIGAGSVVTHDVPKNAIVAGVPAKIINYKNH